MDKLNLLKILKEADEKNLDVHVVYTHWYNLVHSATGYAFVLGMNPNFIRVESDGESDVNICMDNITSIHIVKGE